MAHLTSSESSLPPGWPTTAPLPTAQPAPATPEAALAPETQFTDQRHHIAKVTRLASRDWAKKYDHDALY
mgnify:CR=1 FL=1